MAIEIKQIHEPKLTPFQKMINLLQFYCIRKEVLVPLIIAFVILPSTVGGIALLLLILFFLSRPLLGLHYLFIFKPKTIKEVKNLFPQFVGDNPKYIDFDLAESPGMASITGIAYKNNEIYIADNGKAAIIPWTDIRKWEWEIEGYSGISYHGGTVQDNLAMNMSANRENAERKFEAKVNSGFFVHVNCIEKPIWKFQTNNKQVLTKWFEIFNQIDEGKI